MGGVGERGSIRTRYDSSNDVLYLERPNSDAAYSYEVEDGVYIRVNPWTDELIGATVLAFSSRDLGALSSLFPDDVDWPDARSVHRRE